MTATGTSDARFRVVPGKVGGFSMFCVRSLDGSIVIDVRGGLDIWTSKALERVIDDAARSVFGRVAVSLANCEYCDTSGLRALLEAKMKFGDRLAIVVPPTGAVRRLIAFTKMTESLAPWETVDRAFADIGALG